jgi:hypothetical protein
MDKTKKYFNNIFANKGTSLFSGKLNPRRDWGILIWSFILIVIVFMAFDAYVYFGTDNGDMYVGLDNSELVIERLNTNKLSDVIKRFEVKRMELSDLKREPLIDPAL